MADIAAIPFVNFGLSQAQQAQAQSGGQLEAQQAQALAYQNQITQASMPAVMQALSNGFSDQSSGNAGNPDAGIAATGATGPGGDDGATANASGVAPYNASNLEDMIRDQNFVTPWTQQEQQQLQYWTRLAGLPGMAGDMARARIQALQIQRQARIDNQTANNQRTMGNVYDASAAVVNRDPDGKNPGSTYATLLATDPRDAAVVRQQATTPDGKLDLQQADMLSRQYAAHLAAVSHLYAGRPTDMVNGQLIDKATGQAVVGQDQLFTGSTPDQRGKDYEYALAPIPIKFTDGTTQDMPRWKAPTDQGGFGGRLTPEQYMLQQDQMRRIKPGATPPQQAAASAPGGPPVKPQTSAPVPSSGPVLQQQKLAAARAAAAGTPAPPTGTPQYAQRLQVAITDPQYKAPYSPANLAHTPGAPQPGVQGEIDQYLKQRAAAQEEFNDHAAAASQALMNFKAAQALLTSPDGTDINRFAAGPFGAIMQRLNTLGFRFDTADARMEAAKYLTNGAVQNIRQMYGARPAMFDVKLNVEKAFPNLETMDVSSAKKLIQSQITQSQYMLDSSRRGSMYINANNDPTRFNEWNERYFPRANLLTPQTGSTSSPIAPQTRMSKSGKPMVMGPNGQWHYTS